MAWENTVGRREMELALVVLLVLLFFGTSLIEHERRL